MRTELCGTPLGLILRPILTVRGHSPRHDRQEARLRRAKPRHGDARSFGAFSFSTRTRQRPSSVLQLKPAAPQQLPVQLKMRIRPPQAVLHVHAAAARIHICQTPAEVSVRSASTLSNPAHLVPTRRVAQNPPSPRSGPDNNINIEPTPTADGARTPSLDSRDAYAYPHPGPPPLLLRILLLPRRVTSRRGRRRRTQMDCMYTATRSAQRVFDISPLPIRASARARTPPVAGTLEFKRPSPTFGKYIKSKKHCIASQLTSLAHAELLCMDVYY